MQSIDEGQQDRARIIVASRDSALLRRLWFSEAPVALRVEIAATVWEAMEKLRSGVPADLLILDPPQDGNDSLHIVRWMKRLSPSLPILLVVRGEEPYPRAELMARGVREYIQAPFDDGRLEEAIRRNLLRMHTCAEVEIDSDEIELIGSDGYFIGMSPAMKAVRAQVFQLAQMDVPVLISGEPGTGRETVARLLHRHSLRSGFEFGKVSCAVLPPDLLARELFGGQGVDEFGSTSIRRGKLEVYSKGTVLLEEVAEIPPDLQTSLLKVIRGDRLLRPSGSTYLETDVRILAACTVDHLRDAPHGAGRQSLLGQLSEYTINLPPLRDRREEIPLLLRYFMHRLSKQYGIEPRSFSQETIETWQQYRWPGNLRELEDAVKRYLVVGDQHLAMSGTNLRRGRAPQALPRDGASPAQFAADSERKPIAGATSLRSLVDSVKSEAEKNAISAALEKTGWNRRAAAHLLNVSYRNVLYKIQQYHLVASRGESAPHGNGHREKSEFDSQ